MTKPDTHANKHTDMNLVQSVLFCFTIAQLILLNRKVSLGMLLMYVIDLSPKFAG